MKLLLAITTVCFITAQAVSVLDVVKEDWKTWKLLHDKTYANIVEEKYRMKIFMENTVKISKHNNLALEGKKQYFLKMNHYGDLLHSEFIRMVNGYDHKQKIFRNFFQKFEALQHLEDSSDGVTQIFPANVELPTEIDWRVLGAVSEVKDQGQCGSCWAFAATGALEGQHFRKTGKLVSLSEQNLIDCSTDFGNNGCNGGLMDNAFRYIKANGGIDTEKGYPYYGREDQCHYNRIDIGATDRGIVDVITGDENALKAAVATVGPVAVAIDASAPSFQFYSHGVYDEEHCNPNSLDHGVLVVGYGTSAGGDYWIVKNSWAEHWGDRGYIKMSRNKNNQCGIATEASYPLV